MSDFKIEFLYSNICGVNYAIKTKSDFAHGCNTMKAMASGVAATVSKLFPELKRKDSRLDFNLGQLCSVEMEGVSRWKNFLKATSSRLNLDGQKDPSLGIVPKVYNFYTQKFPGSGSLSYEAIQTCFKNYSSSIPERHYGDSYNPKEHVLVIPEIGCGIAKGFRPLVLRAISKGLVEGIAESRLKYPNVKYPLTVKMIIWNDTDKGDLHELSYLASMYETPNSTPEVDSAVETLLQSSGEESFDSYLKMMARVYGIN